MSTSTQSGPLLRGTLRLFVLNEVHRLAGEGRSYKHIAAVIGLGYSTIRRWRDNDAGIETAYNEGSLRLPLGSIQQRREREIYEVVTNDGEMGTKDLRGVRQSGGGKLTARVLLTVFPGKGAIWLCNCDCGGEIEVAAKRFLEPFEKDGRRGRGVYSCDDCKSPAKVRGHIKSREVLKNSLRDEWVRQGHKRGRDPKWQAYFSERWRDELAKLTTEQELLFETICDGRYDRDTDLWNDYDDDEFPDLKADDHQVQMEALDLALRCDSVEEELKWYEEDRINRARKRLGLTNNA